MAKKAGVGPGTLYRHFRSREELVRAVYQAEVEKMARAAPEFAAKLAPVAALRAWMNLFIDYVAEKHLIAPALNAWVGNPQELFAASSGQIWEAVRALVNRAIASGDIREDLDPIDLLRALVGVANVATSPNWQESARRLVDILILGSRPVPLDEKPIG